MDYKNFGISIMLYRRERRLKQIDLASRAGISRNYLSMIERGVADNLSVDVLVRLAGAMEIDSGELLRLLVESSDGRSGGRQVAGDDWITRESAQ